MANIFLNSDYKEISVEGLYMIDCIADKIYDVYEELSEGNDVTKRITWGGHKGLKSYLQLRYGVVNDWEGTDLLVKIDKGVRYKSRSGMTYGDVTIRRLNDSEALEASTWLESKLPKYNMLGIKPPFETV